ncbi:dihydrolipoyllysine-residue acetyltransferase [Legionella pneumophila]|uniref:Dihydrolipoamide acetyltransferase component of pyruvate dehydrogenase complex n=1 Tax=Legionella pneumophila subsp. pascullei TaxID=91890 RepID=A0AAX2IW18_LEGPN|nr:dihydrolipoyllysine-residue acetyltransferase [Legionella pneumophila]AMP89844.1 dihydrolipoamide acetyltransferase [Legionella pneumophila subsp. pascullei]AMP92490.1 dihydrolipoamide acetyltransferase [Legionella pneumophila subsp. pascullei]AMP95456.1 dihydrolipoamide acetyltransferase [Legionella pneumophila subsp. pascullei]SQG90359.1 pyruvate dehydrogenase E2 component [Legionella pneumophila subsp. pascullei]VEH06551.1 pyruvate dehydrogenase E2 component [Legionella pneumophila subsp
MTKESEIKIPDIGGATQVDVIEILVKEGDSIEVDTPLITLESEKASMDIPSPISGTVTQILVKIGDKVSEGDLIIKAKSDSTINVSSPLEQKAESQKQNLQTKSEEQPVDIKTTTSTPGSKDIEVSIPDIGGATDVDVIDILVKPGMEIEKDQALITLEGDKATMDIPSPYAGKVMEMKIKLGDKVSQGIPILILKISAMPEAPEIEKSQIKNISEQPIKETEKPHEELKSEPISISNLEIAESKSLLISAGPSVRRLAREFGVDLSLVQGSGRKSRITKEDLQKYIKACLSEKTTPGSFNLPSNPVIDFSKFGSIETKPLNKIKKLTGINVHRSWISIPHVTQFDEADITDLEAFRKSESESTKNQDYKLTLLAFVCSVVCKALHEYPQFNASLDASGENIIYKKYYNIGIAVDTANGLVVPVIKNVDKLSVIDIAKEMSRLSTKAREKGLTPIDMSGGCFTISSLGGIGGTAFTPIVNSPEVAILGLSRSVIKPMYDNKEFKPRLMLPISLSYDHRVIDGAEAARFTRFLCECLGDIRRVLL